MDGEFGAAATSGLASSKSSAVRWQRMRAPSAGAQRRRLSCRRPRRDACAQRLKNAQGCAAHADEDAAGGFA